MNRDRSAGRRSGRRSPDETQLTAPPAGLRRPRDLQRPPPTPSDPQSLPAAQPGLDRALQATNTFAAARGPPRRAAPFLLVLLTRGSSDLRWQKEAGPV